ncbi:MAG: SIR2 family protein [Marichromatium sp.]|nr:SIR2 family protein [Marichromatium sp.]
MSSLLESLVDALARGELVPCLGPGALAGVVDRECGEPIPADSDSLILALNGGRPMSRRLMWEFSRAAMNVELKRGRGAVQRFLDATYAGRPWTQAPLHAWLAGTAPGYVIDLNRDLQLQHLYAERPHVLVRGIARVGGTDYRFRIHVHDGSGYREVDQDAVDPALPVLFKPLGSPEPGSTYIASDADFVDYLTELMGGFAIPAFVKARRRGLRYLLLGLNLDRDTERMLVTELIHAAGSPAGWALIPDPTPRARRFCARQGITIVEAGVDELLEGLAYFDDEACATAGALGC